MIPCKFGCVVEGVKNEFSLLKLINLAKSSSFKIMFGKYSQKHTQISYIINM